MNKKAFFDLVRQSVFGGSLKTPQVSGLELIIAEADKRGVNNKYLAYMLATTALETGWTIQPIREYGRGKGRKYGKPAGPYGHVYYGRGYVQLTWLFNYENAKKKLGIDFVKNPDLVMEPRYAVLILFDGMLEGWFTGKKLADYINVGKEDITEFANARRIINGTDKQIKIAKIAMSFLEALRAAGRPEDGVQIVEAPKVPEAPEAPPEAPVAEPEAVSTTSPIIRILRIILNILRGSNAR